MQKKFNRNKSEKVRKIIECFFNLLNDKGYDKLTTNLIASKTGISIGTIYRYFPKGKISILKKILENKFHSILDLEGFKNLNETNFENVLKNMIRKHISSHYLELSYHNALNQAILSDKSFSQEYNSKIFNLFKINGTKIQNSNKMLKKISPVKFLTDLLLIFNTLEAYTHRHIFVMPIFSKDEELVEFLKNVIISEILKFNLSTSNHSIGKHNL
ncbi:MAG: TetR/AcrR family transcriptional regulator [Candidatus Lokiarchaeota archaeon]|nr:TetR/AcrR family transcriptional regulator [Candidatus Lokiarchaeota archaeon]